MVPWTGVVVLLVVSMLRRNAVRRYQDAITAIGYAAYVGVAIQLHIYLAGHTPNTIDAALLGLDRRLHFDPLSFNHIVTSRHNLLMLVLIMSYVLLPVAIAFAWVAEQNRTLRRAVLFGGVFCWICYALFPAVGPAYYDFASGVARYAPRNCMPSMHFAWALLVAINARAKPLRVVFGIYACLIGVATIALGEHYVVDLFAAALYAPLMQLLAVKTEGLMSWKAMTSAVLRQEQAEAKERL